MLRAALPALALVSCLSAAPRAWHNAAGDKSISGEFLSRDASAVTIKRGAFETITIPLDKLHPNDRTWLNTEHPLPPPPPPPVFDTLCFGDSRARVIAKLDSSKLVETDVPETLFGRVGLNGIYRTRPEVSGLQGSLFFDWDNDTLSEISLHGDALPASARDAKLVPQWARLVELLTETFGQPAQANPTLDLTTIGNDQISGTHLWKTEHHGNILLGAIKQDDNYQIVVRFTTDDIQPVRLTETASVPDPG